MPVNWPPPQNTYPVWPPPEYGFQLNFSNWASILEFVQQAEHTGWTIDVPTPAERNLWFKNVQCDEGHNVIGRVVIDPYGRRYPFAACTSAQHRDLLVLWPPYYCGWGSQ